MKKFKSIIRNLQETGSYGEGGSVFNGFSDPVQRTGISDKGIFYGFMNPEQLARINAFVNSFLGGSYVDPKEPLKELAGRLSHIGYIFKVDNSTPLHVGPNQFPVQIFGEKFGVTATTDLTKGFDRGEGYPELLLTFNLQQTKNGYVFTDANITSPETSDQPTVVGSEIDNTKGLQHEDTASVLSVESFLIEDADANAKILTPVYDSLTVAKKNGTFTTEQALDRLDYAVWAGLRSLNENENIITLSDKERKSLAVRLLENFEHAVS